MQEEKAEPCCNPIILTKILTVANFTLAREESP